MYDTQKPDVEELIHYGKKGMKWGVRNASSKVGSSVKRGGTRLADTTPRQAGAAGAKAAKVGAKATGRAVVKGAKVIGDTQFELNANNTASASKITRKAINNYQAKDLSRIRNKPEYQNQQKLRHRLRHPSDPVTKQYRNELKTAYIKRLEEAANSFTNTSGTRQYTIRERGGKLPNQSYFWDVSSRNIEHSDFMSTVQVIMDKDGFVTELRPVDPMLAQGELLTDDFLAHYGKKGMKWGVRNSDRPSGTPRSTERRAKKDAKEVARAKMFYGDGAGTRRKLINKSVEARSKRDPAYKEALDRNLSKQDLSKHAAKAVSERRRKDVAQSTAKTARGIKNLIYNTGAPVTLAAAVAYKASQDPAVQRVVKNAGSKTMKTVRDYQNTQATKDLFKKMGLQ